jgi:hypothetical protein
MIAVCGIGRPSGWRNSAVTANQSARPPDHRGLGEGVDIAPCRMAGGGQPVGGDEDQRHRRQHPGRRPAHPTGTINRERLAAEREGLRERVAMLRP